MSTNTAPTLQTIADICGVTKTTVSLALRNQGRISQGTRDHISKIAKELGYRASPLISAHMTMLRTAKAPKYQATIGVVSDWNKSEYLDPKSVPGKHITGIRKRAKELGYEIDFLTLAEKGMTTRRLVDILKNRGICSLIIPTIISEQGTLELPWEEFSAVSIGYSMRAPLLHRVCHDNYSSMRNALKFLKNHGFKRIGLAMNISDDIRVKSLWSGAYLSSILNNTEEFSSLEFLTAHWTFENYRDWLKKDEPEVVLTINNEIVQWTRKIGYKVPEDLSIVTLANQGSDVTGYDQMPNLVGEAAVEKVVSLLNQNEVGLPQKPQTIMTQGHWARGSTLKLKNPSGQFPPSIY
ncbi:MAG: LacI family DNA-binding transcriptional regulator [Verrucomicrobiota bacterium]